MEEIEPHIYRGGGIALGPEYVGKGYGKQILGLLLEYCSSLGGKGFYLRHFRVEIGGLEPLTYALRTHRSPN